MGLPVQGIMWDCLLGVLCGSVSLGIVWDCLLEVFYGTVCVIYCVGLPVLCIVCDCLCRVDRERHLVLLLYRKSLD